jgi:predicted Zn-dependent protease
MIELCGQNADRLAFVLAHEMAHILEGHAMQRMVGSAVIKTASRANVIPKAAVGALGKLGTQFLEKAYSRQQELAADARGLRLTLAAGFDGQAAVAVFEKLAALEQPGGLSKYFSTHPEAQERIARLRQLLAERSSKTKKPE